MRASKQRWVLSALVRPALWFCFCNLLVSAVSAQCTNPTQVPNGTYTSGDHSQVDNNALSASSFAVSQGATATFAAGNCIHLGPGFRANAIGATVPTTFHAWVDIAPTAISFSPSNQSGLSQPFTWTVSSPSGTVNLSHVFALFHTTSSTTANACYIHYDPASNLLYLANNASDNWLGGFAPGSGGSASNSQCSISGSGASVSTAGTQLTVQVPVTFQSSFSGTKNEYLYALDGSGVTTGWQQMGTWTVPAPPAPDFTLTTAMDHSYIQTQVPSTVSYTLNITPQNGFNSSVSFSLSWPMFGCWSAAFSPAMVTGPPWTTTLTMQCNTTLSGYFWTTVVASGGGKTHELTLYLEVGASPLSITTVTLPGAIVGTPYSASLVVSGGAQPFSWSLASGSLPAGLSLSSGGFGFTTLISGTPTASGTANFTVRVTDIASHSATRDLALTVSPIALTIATTTLSNATAGVPYSASLAASGGTPPYSWSLYSGTLPSGLSLSSGGIISGTPAAAGTSNFTVRVTDGASASTTRALTLTVAAGTLTITTSSLSNAVVGVPYSASLAATGGTPPYTWSLTSGALPSGLSLSGSGTISGTPTAVTTANFTARVTDSASTTNTRGLTLIVSSSTLSITTTSLCNATMGASYSASLTATGGTAPYSWSLESGTLPSGLSLSSGGTISGTPTANGTSNFTVRVTDSVSAMTSMGLSIVVNAAQTYAISGHVTIGSCPLSGVTVALTGGGNPQTQTDATGAYSFSGLASGTYTVTPSKTGYTFTPAPAPFSLTSNQTKDFTASGPATPSREYIRMGGRVVAVANCGAQ